MHTQKIYRVKCYCGSHSLPHNGIISTALVSIPFGLYDAKQQTIDFGNVGVIFGPVSFKNNVLYRAIWSKTSDIEMEMVLPEHQVLKSHRSFSLISVHYSHTLLPRDPSYFYTRHVPFEFTDHNLGIR
jgi:hypothetical protein